MNTIWSPEAIQDLISLRARRMVLRILHDVEHLLPDNPQMGRPGRVPGTREFVIPQTPYIVPLYVQRATIQILRVFHSARRWPDSL